MIYLYFPGNSPLNRNELEEFSALFKEKGVDFYAHEWSHWKDESLSFDLQREMDAVNSYLENNNIDLSDYVILGKSIGTYFCAEFIRNKKEVPSKVVLMGIPTGIGEEKLKAFPEALKNIDSEVILFQNRKDPFGSIEEVRQVLEDVEYSENLMEADNHLYSYSKEVWEKIS